MKHKAFTLVELMVVVAIIAIIAMVAVPMYSTYRCKAAWGNVQSCISDISLRLENYKSNRGVYPTGATVWADLGYAGGTAPECGDNYEATIQSTATAYLILLADTKDPLRCTVGSAFDSDKWGVLSTSPKVYHLCNTADEKSEPLPSLPTGITDPGCGSTAP